MKMRALATLIALCILTLGMTGGTMAQDFKNFTVGSIRLIALADTPNNGAPANPPTQILVGLTDADKAKVTGADMQNAVNAFVLKTLADTILFDTGNGPGRGLLLQSLAAAGVLPADITAVVITHFHGDHVNGLLSEDGSAAFPNAKLYVPAEEVAKGPASDKFLPAYAGKTVQFDWGNEILPGVTAMEALGHTNGHTVYMITNGADKLLIAGDLIHFGGVQLKNPNIAVTYDTDTAKAIASRRRIFDMLATESIPMASMHLIFPAVGKLTKSASAYTFTPLP